MLLGLILGVGFIAKAVFLALGCGILMVTALALRKACRPVMPMVAAVLIFAAIVSSYGVALSRAFGRPTLGESGALNYAWHVNRLQKWVHWEGGVQSADAAWPKPWIARFAQWGTHPPDFGTPIHPSVELQRHPLVYGFAAPVHATYVPYFDPAYWYEGYRHFVRPRYQVIALGKNLIDLIQVLGKHPIFPCSFLALILLQWNARRDRSLLQSAKTSWPVLVFALIGIAIYLPVHLEGRYLAGFLAVLFFYGFTLMPEELTTGRFRAAAAFLLLGVAAELAIYQRPVWHNLLQHRSPTTNEEWTIGEAVRHDGVPSGSTVGVIAWTANLHSDWAYIAGLQITSEIASPEDFNLFWQQSPERQDETLRTFRDAGATAVFVRGKPPGSGSPVWRRLGDTPMWIYRFPSPIALSNAEPSTNTAGAR